MKCDYKMAWDGLKAIMCHEMYAVHVKRDKSELGNHWKVLSRLFYQIDYIF